MYAFDQSLVLIKRNLVGKSEIIRLRSVLNQVKYIFHSRLSNFCLKIREETQKKSLCVNVSAIKALTPPPQA